MLYHHLLLENSNRNPLSMRYCRATTQGHGCVTRTVAILRSARLNGDDNSSADALPAINSSNLSLTPHGLVRDFVRDSYPKGCQHIQLGDLRANLALPAERDSTRLRLYRGSG